jgi:hypothetical protein
MDVQQSQVPVVNQQVSEQVSPVQPQVAQQPSQPQVPPMISSSRKGVWWGIVIVLFLCIGGAAAAYGFLPKNELVIEDQAPGRVVRVQKALLRKEGFVVIFSVSVMDGVHATAATPLLAPEEYLKFDIPLQADPEDMRSGDQLFGILYIDVDGNGSLDPDIDMPMKNVFGLPTRVNFRVM